MKFVRFSFKLIEQTAKMSVFVQKLNPISGVNDWVMQQEDYDYHQEVARASFADMLHDTERNQKYEAALKAAIDLMHAKGKTANVLDIGTGTGLLSMMAVRHGADTVTACEAFKPMSKCALKVIQRNGYENKIRIIPKRSTEITVGINGDLQTPCNILVTEVFDTELIGEGALSTFAHAHKILLEKDCVVVPQSATIYAQVVDSPFVQNWNKIKDIYDNDGSLLINVPDNVKNCSGSVAVHDLQLSQLNASLIKTIVSPLPVLRFDWSGKTPFVFEQSTINTVKAENNGTAQAIFMWWDLQMDTEGRIILSCAPKWAHPDRNQTEKLPWRDHWMQAIYYLPQELRVTSGQEINLITCHDEFSLWFNLKANLKLSDFDYVKPICNCGLHVAFSRTRVGQINDGTRNKKYVNVLQKHVTKDSQVLVLSDGFYTALSAAKLGAKNVYCVETNFLSRRILIDFIRFNKIENVEVFENLKALKGANVSLDLIIGEPYYLSSILPWDNLLFIYLLKGVRNLLKENAKVFPQTAVIKGVAVKFSDLNKIRLPLEKCEGFFMQDFDDLIESSCNISDDNVEAQPLWEYPAVALSSVTTIFTIDMMNVPEKNLSTTGVFNIEQKFGNCNGIALWVDWSHGDSAVTSGPLTEPEIGEQINWDIHTRQGVCLFAPKDVASINYAFKFDFEDGNISFKCS